jgi:hypothetical protein
MSKIRGSPDLIGDRAFERIELAEDPNLENVELDRKRKMFLCAPHKVLKTHRSSSGTTTFSIVTIGITT